MAIYRAVRLTFWTDTKITDKFTPEDKYMYLYLFTNPHTNLAGCYEIGTKHISNETGYSVEKVEKELDRLSRVHKVIKYSNETNELLIINWHKYNWTTSPKFRKVLCKELEAIKCSEFREYLIDVFNGSDTVSDISEYGINTTDTDAVTDTVSVKAKKTVFTPPTAEEVRVYCEERKNGIDAESFVDFYTSKGWQIGKERMKDWKAAVRTWERNSTGRRNSNTSQPKQEKYSDEFFDDVIRKRREARLNADRAKMDNME